MRSLIVVTGLVGLLLGRPAGIAEQPAGHGPKLFQSWFANPLGQAHAPQLAETGCTLRVDGLYVHPFEHRDSVFDAPKSSKIYIRFWKDGTFALNQRSLSVSVEAAAETLVSESNNRYRMNGCAVELEHTFFKRTATGTVVGTDSIRITSGMALPSTSLQRGTYTFIPVDLDAVDKAAEKRLRDRAYSAAITKIVEEVRAPGKATVAVGSARMSENCADPRFVPAPEPIVFPSGSTQFAYQVTGGANPTATIPSAICPTPTTTTQTCTDYAVIQGRPVPVAHTVVFGCDDQKPFVPGEYTLSVGGRSIALTIK